MPKTKSPAPPAPTKHIVPYDNFGVRRGGGGPPFPPLGSGPDQERPPWQHLVVRGPVVWRLAEPLLRSANDLQHLHQCTALRGGGRRGDGQRVVPAFVRAEGHRVNFCKIPDSFANSVRQRLTAYLNAERVYVPWVRWCAEPICTIQAHWLRRGVPNFRPSLLIPKGSNHYKQVLVSVLLVLTQRGPLKGGFKQKLSELIPQRSVLEEQREADTLRNVRRSLENMQ